MFTLHILLNTVFHTIICNGIYIYMKHVIAVNLPTRVAAIVHIYGSYLKSLLNHF